MSRPSDALAAQQASDATLTALLVGGVGVANTMVISVLERRSEIGLRLALGATHGQIRTQFLTESVLLSALGGLGGVLLGIAVTAGYATYQQWPTYVPAWATLGGITATLLIGGLAGLYPTVRTARLMTMRGCFVVGHQGMDTVTSMTGGRTDSTRRSTMPSTPP